jgi:hypothetical protein
MNISRTLLATMFALALAGFGASVLAQDATPEAVIEPSAELMTFTLVERGTNINRIDIGDTGDSAGDMIVWGPDPLYDETNTTDTGATTQGVCVLLDATGLCLATETILFPDGSTLEIQGIQAAGSDRSSRTIVGGSGTYRGATGTVTVAPTDDLTIWTKTFEVGF